MPKSKYVTITLTQHEAGLVRDEIEMASLDSNSSGKRRADLSRAHDKLNAAYVCGHNHVHANGGDLVADLALSLTDVLNIDGDQGYGSQNIPMAVRARCERLISRVWGDGG